MRPDPTLEELKVLYLPPAGRFVEVQVPEFRYAMVDGTGDPQAAPFAQAMQWLFAAMHPIKREGRRRLGRTYVEPPLEALFWTDDPADFAAGRRDRFRWRLLIPAPRWADDAMFAAAIAEVTPQKTRSLRCEPPEGLRLGDLHEGRCVQFLFVGPYQQEAAAIARRLHGDYLPAHGLCPNGPHHEIYLNDPRRTAPERHRTLVRQPVESAR